MLRAVGIVALIVPLLVLAACAQTAVKTVASPSPVIPEGNWTESLTFSGEVAGQMTGIVPNTDVQQSECTGSRTHNGETWSDSFYGTVDASGQNWGLVFLIGNFRGQGTYVDGDVAVQVHSADNTKVWQNLGGDKVTFTVDRGQQSGTIEASLTDAGTGKAGVEKVTGRWNCRG
ncbi:hypothetical protein EPN29_04765 [bacterium]|nr:MAG: hypothetical protein EPN29_04765 [bacterium]